MITRKIKIETISKVKDFVQDVSKVDVNADLSNPDRRYIVDNSHFALVTRLRTGIQTRVRS